MSCCYGAAETSEHVVVGPPKITNKVAIVGNVGVGKTCLVSRFATGQWLGDQKATVGFCYSDVTMNNSRCQIWDTAGSEKYAPVMPMYLRGADVVVVCFDMNSLSPVSDCEAWIGIVESHVCTKIIIAGMKSDILPSDNVTSIAQQVGDSLAKYENALNGRFCHTCITTSAVTGEGVDKLFDHIAEHLPPLDDALTSDRIRL